VSDEHSSSRAALIKDANRARNEALRCADGAAAIALLAAIMVVILALAAAIVPCGRLDPAASSCERVRIIDATAVPTRHVMAL
jgi:hypothetical protein